MYVPISTQPSCVRAWAEAAKAVAEQGDAYNVVIDVETPHVFDEADHEVIDMVDQFLRDHDKYPVSTVVNTIFPTSLYQAYGRPQLYEEYLRIYDSLTESKQWGRYFERMIRQTDSDGKVFRPLDDIITKLIEQTERGQCYKSTHELTIFDPVKDRNRLRNRQCLSFLSFKRHPERGLMLTAMYRNHSYITRCLGNLIGLGRLQAFVASEAGLDVGPLTCISTHAEIDTDGWKLSDARGLIAASAERFSASPEASAAR